MFTNRSPVERVAAIIAMKTGLLALLFVVVGCGDSPGIIVSITSLVTTAPTTGSPDTTPVTLDGGFPVIDPLEVTGNIVTAGSSTVFPISEAVAKRFEDDGYGGRITIDSIGTGAGFERFCTDGDSDIANASRPINDEETALCAGIGRTPLEFRVGTDALAVVVSPNNYFAENLTLGELALVFSTAETWAEINPDFPAHPIARFSPGTDSGTFDYFVEAVFDKDDQPILNSGSIQFSEDDNVLVQGVSQDGCTEGDLRTACAIGYFGFAYLEANSSSLAALNVEGVEPSAATVDNGDYPLARPLFIYSDPQIMADKPAVASFIAYYLTVVNEVIDDAGYFPAPAGALQEAKQTFLGAA